VGLYLMALSLQKHGDRGWSQARVAPTGSDQFVVDYLRAEVLAELAEPTRDFLRRTSILDELNGPLCDAVVDRCDSVAVLSDLSRQLPLVVALDDVGHRYRYHHLLADALRADLEGQEPWLVPELHTRASAWYQSRGDLDPAIRHAKAAGDLERTGALVWAGVPGCIASGRPDRLGSWLGDLDDVEVRSDRWLTLAAAWLGLQTGDPDRMTRWILAAEAQAGPGWTTRIAGEEFAASLASIHITIGDFGLQGSIELCRGVAQGLPPESGFRASGLQNEGIALTLTRRFPEGQASLQQAERLGRALGIPVIEANALAWQGLLALLADDWVLGAPLIARAGDLVRRHGLDRLATSAMSVTAMALLEAARGDRDQARVTLGIARRLTSKVSRIAPWFAVAGPLVQARAAILLGDGALARTLHAEARHRMIPDLADTLLVDFLADTESLLRTLQADGVSGAALTAAELRVLQFLPSRLTFQQIGEHLFLSQTTIKTHAQSIYRKLGASSRDEAVARAQSLGLVESPALD
jgi:LuxR family maltose regulon positive regulatory protein